MDDDELTKILHQIASTDRTPEYEYHSDDMNPERYLNAKGIPPDTGQRWCTPREICEQYLRDIRSGELDMI